MTKNPQTPTAEIQGIKQSTLNSKGTVKLFYTTYIDYTFHVNTIDSVNTYIWKGQRLQSAELSTLVPNRTLHPQTGRDNCIASNHLIPPLQNSPR
jgi:hypothetical protein